MINLESNLELYLRIALYCATDLKLYMILLQLILTDCAVVNYPRLMTLLLKHLPINLLD